MRYPLAPFFALTGWTMTQVRQVAPCGGDEYQRRLREGVSERIADRLATAAGLHPFEVWPEMADMQARDVSRPCDECGVLFIPTRNGHRFCSRNCRDRRHERTKYRSDPEFRARKRAARRGYYAQVAEYEKARERRRYWQSKGAA